jgi:hypothetical protein
LAVVVRLALIVAGRGSASIVDENPGGQLTVSRPARWSGCRARCARCGPSVVWLRGGDGDIRRPERAAAAEGDGRPQTSAWTGRTRGCARVARHQTLSRPERPSLWRTRAPRGQSRRSATPHRAP